MTVKFCIVSGKWLEAIGSGGCSHDKPHSLENYVRVSLESLKPQYQTYTPKTLKAYQEAFDELPDESAGIWRFRTLFTLAQSESVFCINFIPVNTSKAQIIQVMRLKAEQDTSLQEVFCHEHLDLKYLLPVRAVDQVFDLSLLKISDTIGSLQTQIPDIEKALERFLKDPHARGLAVTVEDKPQKTYMWLK
jgi:hypothetical protein